MGRVSKTGIKGLNFRADGRAYIDLRYRDPATGKALRYQENMPDGISRAAARERGRLVLQAALTGTLVRRGDERPETLGEAFGRYLEICKTNAARTAGSDPKYKERHRDRWVETLGAGFQLAAFSELSVEKHKKRRREQGKKAGTINRELVTAKHFLGRCVAWGWLPRRPAVSLLQEPPPRVRWLTDAEREALSAELATGQRSAFRLVVAAALLSGQRLGKIIQLQRTDVDLVNRELTISDMAKGGRRRTTHVPISPELAEVLTEALAAQPEPSAWVFTTRRRKGGVRPYTRSGASTFFARLVKAAGLRNFRFHDLRHDFATRVRRGGAGLDAVQALLGHSSPAMTQRYAHLGRGELAAAAGAAVGLNKIACPLPSASAKPRAKKPKTAVAAR